MIGYLLTRPAIRNWIIKRAMRTPDDPIYAADGSGEIYMNRYWLFNPLTKKSDGEWVRKHRMIPFSIRVHNIRLPDDDRHLHDHPFNARTWIMVGGYEELRAEYIDYYGETGRHRNPAFLGERYIGGNYEDDLVGVEYARHEGSSTTLTFEHYHKITRIYEHDNPIGPGAWTLFCFGDYVGPWGFLVDGAKMVHREYIDKFKQKVTM
jgi:hypothetical protein